MFFFCVSACVCVCVWVGGRAGGHGPSARVTQIRVQLLHAKLDVMFGRPEMTSDENKSGNVKDVFHQGG